MDEFEHSLRTNLIAIRSVLNDAPPHRRAELVEAATQAENRLYLYQLSIGSAAAYFTYERTQDVRPS